MKVFQDWFIVGCRRSFKLLNSQSGNLKQEAVERCPLDQNVLVQGGMLVTIVVLLA